MPIPRNWTPRLEPPLGRCLAVCLLLPTLEYSTDVSSDEETSYRWSCVASEAFATRVLRNAPEAAKKDSPRDGPEHITHILNPETALKLEPF